ncbi:MAG TPA: ribosome maturation factor RimM [Edaphobacter sp.]|nr:ribosome maturation factor RimM [Edaphobacter sp.]
MIDDSTTSWIVLAHLLRPQGRKGELLAELLTDFPERFERQKRVFLAPENFAGEEGQARAMEVDSFWLPVGKNEGRIVLQFVGVDSITSAEEIAGLDVIVPYAERLPLDDESEYVSDLIGCTVYDGPNAVGVIDDVQFPSTPDGARKLAEAAPLLAVLSPAGDEILIPFAKAFLVGVNVIEKRVEMALPEGLVEVNRASGTNSDQKR